MSAISATSAKSPMESAKIERWIPYTGLVVSLVLALIIGPRTPFSYAVILGGSAAVAVWVRLGAPLVRARDASGPRGVIYYLVLLALLAVLILTNPLFGILGFTGYLHTVVLPGRTRLAGVAGTAALMAVSQMGGADRIYGVGVYIYVALIAVNLAIAGVMTVTGAAEAEHRRRLAEANEKLRETLEENAELHAQLVAQAREAGVLDERHRMAGEIHDTLAQGLTGIVRQLEVVERLDGDADKRHHHLTLARELARESLAEARRSVQAMRPGPLAAAQLPEALAELAASWSRNAGIEARVEVSGEAVALSPDVEKVLFRAAQEALANAGKYSGAGRVGVTLSYALDAVVLDVADDGCGFDTDRPSASAAEPSANGTGYGLTAMRSRVKQIGGTLTIASGHGAGTTISAAVPLTLG